MASTPEPVPAAQELLPDAANAAPPGHLLRALEWRTGMEYVSARLAMRRIAGWPQGDGHPVLVLPGFLAGPTSTQFLRNVLRQLNYRVYDWGLGYNMGYRGSMKESLPARLHHIKERAGGSRVSIIGWSAGGIYARELARALPDDVRSVITLGSPFRGNHRAQPLSVPTTCIYSKSDGIVAWQCCTSLPAPETENIEVRSSHLGYGHNVQTLSVIADRLAQPENSWRPFRR